LYKIPSLAIPSSVGVLISPPMAPMSEKPMSSAIIKIIFGCFTVDSFLQAEKRKTRIIRETIEKPADFFIGHLILVKVSNKDKNLLENQIFFANPIYLISIIMNEVGVKMRYINNFSETDVSIDFKLTSLLPQDFLYGSLKFVSLIYWALPIK
jgi:hypothetical protein